MKKTVIDWNGKALPALLVSSVRHIGAFSGYAPGNGTSLEGDALSVSLCPDAWRKIARLGGQPEWELKKAGGCFVDMIELDAATRKDMLKEACRQDLLVRVNAWEARMPDEESEFISIVCQTREEALGEIDGCDDALLKPVLTHRTGSKFRYKPFYGQLGSHIEDVALSQMLEKEGICDGLWWNEKFAPDEYSAPRGGIFASRVPEWSAIRIEN